MDLSTTSKMLKEFENRRTSINSKYIEKPLPLSPLSPPPVLKQLPPSSQKQFNNNEYKQDNNNNNSELPLGIYKFILIRMDKIER